jgi:hypothetical protein
MNIFYYKDVNNSKIIWSHAYDIGTFLSVIDEDFKKATGIDPIKAKNVVVFWKNAKDSFEPVCLERHSN